MSQQSLESWIEIPQDSDFTLANIPFGIFSDSFAGPRVGTRIGDTVVDLNALQSEGYLQGLGLPEGIFASSVLNPFMALGRSVAGLVRNRIIELFSADNQALQSNAEVQEKILRHDNQVVMCMPVNVGDYTDFYSSIEHATNVGKMFRDPDNALLPNWKYIPVGYHGRASSIVVSGTPVRRPNGQRKLPTEDAPTFGPCRTLDFELEMAFVTCKPTTLGETLTPKDAEEHIFGMVLFNDWSARDIQKWEYVPLGPYLGKSFASSVSPWVVTMDALEPFRTQGPKQDPAPLPYLECDVNANYDINLEVSIKPDGSHDEAKVCSSNYKYMYWNMLQQLAHQASNGCNINVGDMYASGTISGPTEDSFGSMLELSWAGSKTLPMPDGSERKFIQDGDTVIMRGHSGEGKNRVGFGEVKGQVLPAK